MIESNEVYEMTEITYPIQYDQSGRMKYNPGLHCSQNEGWSNDDIDYLINWYSKIGIEEMSLAIGKTEGSIAHKVYSLRKRGLMPIESQCRAARILKPSKRRKTSKGPGQSTQRSINKNSTSLYHMEGGIQVVS